LAEREISFGPFRFIPAQQLLLEGEAPVRLGSRAFQILEALVERAGELVGKDELVARVWPRMTVDENTLRVNVAGLRKALGDGQPGRRYIANVTGRGYRFVTPVKISEQHPSHAPDALVPARGHNLPISQSRVVGRSDIISALSERLPRHRFVTIAGAGGVGKTTVALALAEALLPAYRDGVRFVDLAPIDDVQYVLNAVGASVGIIVRSDDAIPQLIRFLRDKQMLLVLDSCEHVIERAAVLAERLSADLPEIHILATSREPLGANGEYVHRLFPLECPAASTDLTAAKALAFPAVQLFVERSAAIVDGFELSDLDAPIVADICRKLSGIPLAIELAAARVDAFGIGHLSVLLEDRLRILKRGKRTAQPRHQSLAATLDWSYEFLPDVERMVLRRLSVFAGVFTLSSAIAVAGDADTDVVEAVANLVTKSLVSADVGGRVVQYRLLDTTRAYALQKLAENGEFDNYARRHAQHHLDWFERAEVDWRTLAVEEWLEGYGRRIDDIRTALTWAFSPQGDPSLGVTLTVASIPLWLEHSLMHECRERVERALATQAAQPAHNAREELKLLLALEVALRFVGGRLYENDDLPIRALALAERLGDYAARGQVLYDWAIRRFHVGDYRGMLTFAEKCRAIADEGDNAKLKVMGDALAAYAMSFLGDHREARGYIDPVVNDSGLPHQNTLFVARSMLPEMVWVQGFPDQATRWARRALADTKKTGNALIISNALAHAACPVALHTGDLAEAERLVGMLSSCSDKHSLNNWNALAHCWKGIILLRQSELAGLSVLRAALGRLRNGRFAFHYALSLGALAEGLAAAGQFVSAHQAIDEALELAARKEEQWCMAELLRIQGEIMRSEGSVEPDGAAEERFREALVWGRRQGALSWELRAATSLAKLLRDEGKTAAACALLSEVYGRFSEGFDTLDLRTARALIEELV
jgi:predicted ATPase/DNA-binding winged helix-turn-helix (wHTH) protein